MGKLKTTTRPKSLYSSNSRKTASKNASAYYCTPFTAQPSNCDYFSSKPLICSPTWASRPRPRIDVKASTQCSDRVQPDLQSYQAISHVRDAFSRTSPLPNRRPPIDRRRSMSPYAISHLAHKLPSPKTRHRIEQLRREAYSELMRSAQDYNDRLVARMRYIESLSPEEQRSYFARLENEADVEEGTDDEDGMIGLREAMGQVGMKDYSDVLKYQKFMETDPFRINEVNTWQPSWGDQYL